MYTSQQMADYAIRQYNLMNESNIALNFVDFTCNVHETMQSYAYVVMVFNTLNATASYKRNKYGPQVLSHNLLILDPWSVSPISEDTT